MKNTNGGVEIFSLIKTALVSLSLLFTSNVLGIETQRVNSYETQLAGWLPYCSSKKTSKISCPCGCTPTPGGGYCTSCSGKSSSSSSSSSSGSSSSSKSKSCIPLGSSCLGGSCCSPYECKYINGGVKCAKSDTPEEKPEKICTSGAKRCSASGDSIQKCNSAGTAWSVTVERCSNGCSNAKCKEEEDSSCIEKGGYCGSNKKCCSSYSCLTTPYGKVCGTAPEKGCASDSVKCQAEGSVSYIYKCDSNGMYQKSARCDFGCSGNSCKVGGCIPGSKVCTSDLSGIKTCSSDSKNWVTSHCQYGCNKSVKLCNTAPSSTGVSSVLTGAECTKKGGSCASISSTCGKEYGQSDCPSGSKCGVHCVTGNSNTQLYGSVGVSTLDSASVPLSSLSSNVNIVAEEAYEIVSQLQPGIWNYYNNSSSIKDLAYLYNPDEFESMNPEVGEAQKHNSDLYWCTWLVNNTYRTVDEDFPIYTSASKMEDYFKDKDKNGGKYEFKDNNSVSVDQIKSGDVIFYTTYDNSVTPPREGHHVGIVYSSDAVYSSNGTIVDGSITTLEANAPHVSLTIPVKADNSGELIDIVNSTIDTDMTFTIDGFGSPSYAEL